MTLGDEFQALVYGNAGATIGDLLGQMAGGLTQQGAMFAGEQIPVQGNGTVDGGNILQLLSNDHVNLLLQQLNANQAPGQQLPVPSWTQSQAPSVQQMDIDDGYLRRQGGDSGWGDRGRGRGRGRGVRGRGKRRPCAFFAEGR
jgi:hypothetical protein